MPFGSIPVSEAGCPTPPDFLCSFVVSLNFMRLSLMKGAHAVLSMSAYRKFGASRCFSRDVGYRRTPPQACRGCHNTVGVPHVRTSVARISYYTALATTTYAAFSQRKPHEVAQRHLPRQEIRDTWAENDGRSPTTAFRSWHSLFHPDGSEAFNDTCRANCLTHH